LQQFYYEGDFLQVRQPIYIKKAGDFAKIAEKMQFVHHLFIIVCYNRLINIY